MSRYEKERPQYSLYELASSTETFVDAYADHCGIIAIDELVRLYAKLFPDFGMDYESMREAAGRRPRARGGTCGTWEHDGREYALCPSISDAGYMGWYTHLLMRHYWGEDEGLRDEEPPGLARHERALRAMLVEHHEAHPVKELTLEELAQGRLQRIMSCPGVTRLVDELLRVRMRRPDRPKRRVTERGFITVCAGRRMCLASTMIDIGNSRAYEDAQHLMTCTFPQGSCDFDPLRDEPDPKVLLAAEVAYRELPLWGLNGWSQNEVREQELADVRERAEPRRDAAREDDVGDAYDDRHASEGRAEGEGGHEYDDIPL